VKYQSIYDSPRQRVAKSPLLAALISAAVVDIWRNVIRIDPDWDEMTIIPYSLKVGASTQLMALSLDAMYNLVTTESKVGSCEIFDTLLFTMEDWNANTKSLKKLPTSTTIENPAHIGVGREIHWQIKRNLLAPEPVRDTHLADFLPLAALGLSINSDIAESLKAFAQLQDKFQTNFDEEFIIQIYSATKANGNTSMAYENLDEIILDFKTSPSLAMSYAFTFGLKNGLMNFFNAWPNRIDIFPLLERLAVKINKLGLTFRFT
jgi:hypothetical protein